MRPEATTTPGLQYSCGHEGTEHIRARFIQSTNMMPNERPPRPKTLGSHDSHAANTSAPSPNPAQTACDPIRSGSSKIGSAAAQLPGASRLAPSQLTQLGHSGDDPRGLTAPPPCLWGRPRGGTHPAPPCGPGGTLTARGGASHRGQR